MNKIKSASGAFFIWSNDDKSNYQRRYSMLLAGGLVLASCEEKCSAGDCGKKTNECTAFPACKGKGGALDISPCELSCGLLGK